MTNYVLFSAIFFLLQIQQLTSQFNFILYPQSATGNFTFVPIVTLSSGDVVCGWVSSSQQVEFQLYTMYGYQKTQPPSTIASGAHPFVMSPLPAGGFVAAWWVPGLKEYMFQVFDNSGASTTSANIVGTCSTCSNNEWIWVTGIIGVTGSNPTIAAVWRTTPTNSVVSTYSSSLSVFAGPITVTSYDMNYGDFVGSAGNGNIIISFMQSIDKCGHYDIFNPSLGSVCNNILCPSNIDSIASTYIGNSTVAVVQGGGNNIETFLINGCSMGSIVRETSYWSQGKVFAATLPNREYVMSWIWPFFQFATNQIEHSNNSGGFVSYEHDIGGVNTACIRNYITTLSNGEYLTSFVDNFGRAVITRFTGSGYQIPFQLCTLDSQCWPDLLCNFITHICVQCRTNIECSGLTPNCYNYDDTCVGCYENYQCNSYLCSFTHLSCIPVLSLSQVSVTHYMTVLALKSTDAMNATLPFNELFQLTLSGIPSSGYSLNYEEISNKEIDIFITFNTDPNNYYPTATINLTHPSNYETLAGVPVYSTIASTNIKLLPYLSQAELAMVGNLKSKLGGLTSGSTAGSGGLMILFPNLAATVIGLLQVFSYLMVINVKMPFNVILIFQLAQSSNFGFLPFSDLFSNVSQIPTPTKFTDQGINALFVTNIGPSIVLIAGLVGTIFLAQSLLKITQGRVKFVETICQLAIDSLIWSGVLTLLFSNFLNIAIYSFLQVRYPVFDSKIHIISAVLGIVVAICCIALPFLVFQIHKRYQSQPELLEKKFNPISQGFKKGGSIVQRSFFALFLLQNVVYAVALTCLQDYPIIQITILILANIAILLAFRENKPFQKKSLAFLNILINLTTLMIFPIVAILIYDDQYKFMNPNSRIQIGWGIIGLFFLCIFGMVGVIIYQYLMAVQKGFAWIKEKLTKNRAPKVTPSIETATSASIINLTDTGDFERTLSTKQGRETKFNKIQVKAME